MPRYEINPDMLVNLGRVEGLRIMQPKHRCSQCAIAIDPQFETCYKCNNNIYDVKPLDHGHSVSMYFVSGVSRQIQHISDLRPVIDLSRYIRKSKVGKHHEQMAEILYFGLENYEELLEYDLYTAPPSGSPGDNHMHSIGRIVSDKVGIPFDDTMCKKEDYQAQKHMDSLQDRIENVRDKIGWGESESGINRAVVFDDIATSLATVVNTARALKEHGVDEVAMLTIGRDQDIFTLEQAGVLIAG